MSKENFSLRDAGFPGMVETTLNMPLITGLNMIVTKGKITWTPKELYRGWTVISPPYVPYTFTMFTMKNLLYSKFPYKVIENGKVVGIRKSRAILVGGLSGAIASVVCNPIERIQVYQNANGMGLGDAVKSIVKGQGYSGVYTGYVGILMREVLFTIALFSISDSLDNLFTQKFKKFIDKHPSSGSLIVSTVSRFLSGGMIGAATCPINNIRIVQQGLHTSQPRMGFLEAARKLNSEGRLMSGWQFRIGRIGLAIIWVRAAESMLYKLFRD